MAFTLLVNGVQYSVDAEPETPLLWVLRDSIGLTGTKYGCGIGQCGACAVLIDGAAVRSCFMQAGRAVGRKITTIEGLSSDGSHPVQLAWKEFDVPRLLDATKRTSSKRTGCSHALVSRGNSSRNQCLDYDRARRHGNDSSRPDRTRNRRLHGEPDDDRRGTSV